MNACEMYEYKYMSKDRCAYKVLSMELKEFKY